MTENPPEDETPLASDRDVLRAAYHRIVDLMEVVGLGDEPRYLLDGAIDSFIEYLLPEAWKADIPLRAKLADKYRARFYGEIQKINQEYASENNRRTHLAGIENTVEYEADKEIVSALKKLLEAKGILNYFEEGGGELKEIGGRR